MPKVIDKYVLEDKIGNGQFGEVYRGRHQDTLDVVAIKSIRRDMIKGKFYELLENEIKVLKTCDNPHIIKLHALKKTPHNYYLMLEYCNGGDMLAKVKNDGKIPEVQVIRYLCQILNAFQALVKHKIMHRDFKLANILLHDGSIKIADFGFAKLLSNEDYTTTMLGSPLNMAPEVLGGNKYNSKADIWSIGACIFEMLYGKPPFIASNMVDLAKLIKTKPLVLPEEPEVCEEMRSVLRRMLTPDVKKRIQWEELFNHPITNYLMKKRKNEVELELAQDESLMINTSKCYLKNNLVLSDIKEIKSKSQINDYLVDIIRNGKKGQHQIQDTSTVKGSDKGSNLSKLCRANSKRILHYRNIYAFLASIADQIINQNETPHHQIAAYVIVRKILSMIEWLVQIMESKESPFEGVQSWHQYVKQDDFREIKEYISKEYQVFNVFNQSLEPLIKKKSLEGSYDMDIKELIGGAFKASTYVKYLKSFLFEIASRASLISLDKHCLDQSKIDWKLLYFGLCVVDVDSTFGKGQSQFDFKKFYDSFEDIDEEKMLLYVQDSIKKLS